jgi:hypothetical protein
MDAMKAIERANDPPDTAQEFRASFEQEHGATRSGLSMSSEVGAHNGAARHASKRVESGRTRNVAWSSLARTGRPGVWAR